jgi:hypothetical protein
MTDPTDRSSEEVVFSTFPTIASWRVTTRDAFRPQQGSELWNDDQDWPYFPTSTIAWSGLVSAVDHLDAIKRHVEARCLFSLAHLTLCRSALIGGAQAVWVLAPPADSSGAPLITRLRCPCTSTGISPINVTRCMSRCWPS